MKIFNLHSASIIQSIRSWTIGLVISSSLFTPWTALAEEIQFKNWSFISDFNKNIDGYAALTISTNKENQALSIQCDSNNNSSLTLLDSDGYWVNAGEEYMIQAQIDSGKIFDLNAIVSGEKSINIDHSYVTDEFIESLLKGASIKFGITRTAGVDYPVFSLMGFTATIEMMSGYCEAISGLNNEGFIKPTTESDYDRMVDEGFVTPN